MRGLSRVELDDKSPGDCVRVIPSLEELIEQADKSVTCGVYFLFWRTQLVYIGRSLFVPGRIHQHRRDGKIAFTHSTYLPCSEEDSLHIERVAIELYRPKCNAVNKAPNLTAEDWITAHRQGKVGPTVNALKKAAGILLLDGREN